MPAQRFLRLDHNTAKAKPSHYLATTAPVVRSAFVVPWNRAPFRVLLMLVPYYIGNLQTGPEFRELSMRENG